MAAVTITDTGLDEVGGSVTFNQVNNGNPITLYGFKLDFKFPVNSTEHPTTALDSNGDLTFTNNEVSSITSPKITLKGILLTDDTSTISQLISLSRTRGIKSLSGGLGVINGFPEVSNSSINVIVKNISMTEAIRNSTNTADVTIELEQVN